MRTIRLALLVAAACCFAACSFDPSGLGAKANGDGGNHPADAAAIDAPPGAIDAPPGHTFDARPDSQPAGPPDANIGVVCGNATCAANQVCCETAGGIGGGNPQFDCADKCDKGQGTFACDGPEDCPGQECCFSRTDSSCAASCGIGEQQACRTDADCPGGVDSCCPTQYPNVELCGICF